MSYDSVRNTQFSSDDSSGSLATILTCAKYTRLLVSLDSPTNDDSKIIQFICHNFSISIPVSQLNLDSMSTRHEHHSFQAGESSQQANTLTGWQSRPNLDSTARQHLTSTCFPLGENLQTPSPGNLSLSLGQNCPYCVQHHPFHSNSYEGNCHHR
jgi:hypothetical protein